MSIGSNIPHWSAAKKLSPIWSVAGSVWAGSGIAMTKPSPVALPSGVKISMTSVWSLGRQPTRVEAVPPRIPSGSTIPVPSSKLNS